jgi:hypothetical protein
MPRLAASLAIAAIAATGLVVEAPVAHAQSAVCQEGGQLLNKRREIVQRLQELNKKKSSPETIRTACRGFGELVTNGNAAIKWMEANGDWCQVPGQLREGMKADNERAEKLRGQACQAANKVAEMERRAKQQQQQQQGSGLLGGDGLTGPMRLPRGAL